MTDTSTKLVDLAAALLRDVPRYEPDNPLDSAPSMKDDPQGDWLSRDAVLTALSRALDGVDERAGALTRRLRKTEEAGHIHHLSKADRLAAADLITALLAQNAALRAERDELVKDKRWIMEERDRTFALMLARAEAAEAARLRALPAVEPMVKKADPNCTRCDGSGYIWGTRCNCTEQPDLPAAETALAAERAKVEKLRGALQIARVHVANNAEGWSVSRGAARDDLTIVDAALTTEERHE